MRCAPRSSKWPDPPASMGTDLTEGLPGAIAQLERTVPELAGAHSQAAKANAQQIANTNSRGLIGEVVAAYDQLESMHEITELAAETDQVRRTAVALHAPLQATLRATIQQGQQMANAPGQAARGRLPSAACCHAPAIRHPDAEIQAARGCIAASDARADAARSNPFGFDGMARLDQQ